MTKYPDIRLFINGQWRQTSETAPVVNPVDGSAIGTVPIATQTDLDDAVNASVKGFRLWRNTAPRERSDIILKAARIMRERLEDIAYSNTLEVGKTLSESRQEALRACETMEWDAGEGMRLYGRLIPGAPGVRNTVFRQPIGPVAAFSAWNFPINQAARKISAALAAGCSIILKSPGDTPAGAVHIARALQEAGLPDGVLNLVHGRSNEISDFLISDDRIRLVAFTGSTSVGKHLSMLAAENMKPVLMELGGHAPVIVCDDIDQEAIARQCAVRKFRNAGQVCTSPTRFYVTQDSFSVFVKSFAAEASSVNVGNGLHEDTEMGPLANSRRLQAMTLVVEDAVAKGADLISGGLRIGSSGNFFEPTVLANVPSSAMIMKEEPFGPIAIINAVKTLDEAIQQANNLPLGLAAYGFTKSSAAADLMANEIEVGQLSINTFETSRPETPFGGVKASGYGREGGSEGLDHYTVVKNVTHKME